MAIILTRGGIWVTKCPDAIKEAMEALGGEATIEEVRCWIDDKYPNRWKDIATSMAYLTYPGNKASHYPISERFLERVSRGRYRLRVVVQG